MAGFIKGNNFLGYIPQKFKQLLKLNINFDDQIVTNSKAIGPTEAKVGYSGMSKVMRFALGLADSMEQPLVAFYDKAYPARREYLKKFAQNSEIQWCLETICNATIRFNDENYYMLPKFLFGNLSIKEDLKKKIEEKLQENFKRIYQVLDFRNTNTAWHIVKKFLIEGFLCYEIIYDKTNSNIIGFKTLDPTTIVQEIRFINESYSRIWVQNPDDPRNKRELLDNQVIYISYVKANDYARVSYVENLIENYKKMKVLQNIDIIEYFYKKFQIDSKIPGSRFFRGQPNMLIPDLNVGMDREEEFFSTFIEQIRTMIEPIIRKPLQIQMCLDFPELAGDVEFVNGFHFTYFSDGYWEERIEQKIMFDRVQQIMGLNGLMDNIVGEPIFDATWACKKFLVCLDE